MGYFSSPDDTFIRGASASGYIFGLPIPQVNAPNLPVPGSGSLFGPNDINGNQTFATIGVPFTPTSKVYGDGWPSILRNGLIRQKYAGYYDDDVTWFTTRDKVANSDVQDTFIGFGSQSLPIDEAYSLQWTGYFKAPETGLYNFWTISDDSSMFWIGDDAKYGYNRTNALVDNGGAHGSSPMDPKRSVSLVAGEYYPVRMQFGEAGGGESCQLFFSCNAGYPYPTSDFSGIMFYDPVDPKFGE